MVEGGEVGKERGGGNVEMGDEAGWLIPELFGRQTLAWLRYRAFTSKSSLDVLALGPEKDLSR